MRVPDRVAHAVTAALVVTIAAGCAHEEARRAAPRPDHEVVALNREAAAAYGRGERDLARDKLMRALAVARDADVDEGSAAARTRANLGALYVLAYAKRAAGIRQLAAALRIDPNVRPSSAFSAPAVDRAMVAARKQARRAEAASKDDDDEPVAEAPAAPPEEDRSSARSSEARARRTAEDDDAGEVRARADARPDDDEQGDRHRRGAGAVWIGIGAGTGSGWHPTHALEGASDLNTTSGYSNSGLVLSPELGWQITNGFAIAIAGRHQFLPANGWQAGQGSEPPRMAHAAFLRLVWSMGTGNAVWLASFSAGGGDGFRLMVPRRPNAGLAHDDTVRGGPLAFGPGFGFAYHFHRAFAWYAESRLLVGAPDLATVLEIGTGPQVAF
jgi:hypothetical protein